ncbi:MAG TPA: nuclear transport factor 2 family protein [Caulobacteraceae bacterium]|nr:nuclear transport factor 2 family protein [Caulobacteraceae bacterium]
MVGDKDMAAFVKAFFDAIEAGDIDTVRASYAPHVAIWHNTDELENTREENLAVLSGLVKRTKSRCYEKRRVQVFPGGFVQQHELRIIRPDDVELTLPACIVCRVEYGKIVRLDEYFDSARVEQLRAPARAV